MFVVVKSAGHNETIVRNSDGEVITYDHFEDAERSAHFHSFDGYSYSVVEAVGEYGPKSH